MPDMVMLEIEEKMEKTIVAFNKELATIRTGRANPNILDAIAIEYYGAKTPVKQVASITVPEANQIYIKPFDKSTTKSIEKAISESQLGLAPQNDGIGLRLIFPPMNEERRKELIKIVAKYEEGAKVALRNIRRDGNDAIKKLKLTEDDEKGYLEDIQTMTDKKIEEIDSITKHKNQELMQI